MRHKFKETDANKAIFYQMEYVTDKDICCETNNNRKTL